MRLASLVAGAIAASTVAAHPGHDHHQELAQRTAFLQHSKKDLSHCAEKMRARGLEKRATERRAAMVTGLRKRGNIQGMPRASIITPF